MGPGVVPEMIDLLGKQVASPVQFVKGLKTLYEAGARIFVEVGPKRVLYGFVEDVLGERDGVYSLFTNHPENRRSRIGQSGAVRPVCLRAGRRGGRPVAAAPGAVRTGRPRNRGSRHRRRGCASAPARNAVLRRPLRSARCNPAATVTCSSATCSPISSSGISDLFRRHRPAGPA